MKNQSTFYLMLSSIFTACIVCGNLIFQKFFYLNMFDWHVFEISVGILPYPVTFLVTDLVCEIYGKKEAQTVVRGGIIASLFVVIIVLISDSLPATSWSPINDETFHLVFYFYGPALLSSLIATTTSQYLDIYIFHYLKTLTHNKHLWLRNNCSTIISQFVDTFVVTTLLCFIGIIPWENVHYIFFSSFLFKVLCALIDTPFFYLGVYFLKNKENLSFSLNSKI